MTDLTEFTARKAANGGWIVAEIAAPGCQANTLGAFTEAHAMLAFLREKLDGEHHPFALGNGGRCLHCGLPANYPVHMA
jgi:hypothetical protein